MGWPSIPSWRDVQSSAARTFDQVRHATGTVASTAQTYGRAAVTGAQRLGQQGVDLGRRVLANPDAAVRGVASAARNGLAQVEQAAQTGIRDGVRSASRAIGDVATTARNHVSGNDIASRVVRNAITEVEQRSRFTVGAAGGVAYEAVGLVGTVGTLSVGAAELNYSPSARADFGRAVTGVATRAGHAVADYGRAVATDPSRVGRDALATADAAYQGTNGFVGGQVQRYGDAIRRGEGAETIGFDVGRVGANFIPIGGGAKLAATGTRAATEMAAVGGRAILREGGELAARETTTLARVAGAEARVTTLAVSSEARAAAEVAGARLVRGSESSGGTVRVSRSGGLRAQDLAAASRQSGREVALYRDAATGDRFVAFGNRTGVEVPQGAKVIAHTQPGTGAAAVRASVADEAALTRLGQRSSVIIDQGGTAASRFHATEQGAALARRETGAVRLHTPNTPLSPRLPESDFNRLAAISGEGSHVKPSGANWNQAPNFDKWQARGGKIVAESDGSYTFIRPDRAQVRYNKDGFPDFTPHLDHPSGVTEVPVAQTGKNGADFKAANEAAGHKEWGSGPPADYTWHHKEDGAVMQLVPRDIHDKTIGGFGHRGGVSVGGGH